VRAGGFFLRKARIGETDPTVGARTLRTGQCAKSQCYSRHEFGEAASAVTSRIDADSYKLQVRTDKPAGSILLRRV
jgi:hypothetical protein